MNVRGARGGRPAARRLAFVHPSVARTDLTRGGALRDGGILRAEAGEWARRRQNARASAGREARLEKRIAASSSWARAGVSVGVKSL